MDESHNRNFDPRWPSPFASMTPTVRSWAVAAFSHLTPAAQGSGRDRHCQCFPHVCAIAGAGKVRPDLSRSPGAIRRRTGQ